MATQLKTVELPEREAWRPALAAFYRAEAMPQSAEAVELGYPLSHSDCRQIDALKVALELAP